MASPQLERTSGSLVGRERECAAIDRLLELSTRAESSCLVLRGEAGTGKTALPRHAAERGGPRRVLRTTGVESESDLAFAGLYGLLRPIVDMLGELPETQADALAGALGLAATAGSDRLLVSAATLSLLAAGADEAPLLCLIDDAQFLDTASAEALVFSARRLGAEPVAMLFAVREGEARTFEAPGVPGFLVAVQEPPVVRSRAGGYPDRSVEFTRGWPVNRRVGSRVWAGTIESAGRRRQTGRGRTRRVRRACLRRRR